MTNAIVNQSIDRSIDRSVGRPVKKTSFYKYECTKHHDRIKIIYYTSNLNV